MFHIYMSVYVMSRDLKPQGEFGDAQLTSEISDIYLMRSFHVLLYQKS